MTAEMTGHPIPGLSGRETLSKHEADVLQAVMNFRQIIGTAKQHFQRVQAECDLSGAQLWALWQIDASPGLKVGELARHLSIHQSTASNLLDQLQRKDLIVRDRKDTDQRVVRVSLTPAGKAILQKAPGPARGVLPDAIDRLSEDALQQLNAMLRLVMAKMRVQDIASAKHPLSDLIT